MNGGTKKPEISNDRENSYNPDNRFAGYLASDIFQECVYNAAVKTVGRALQTAANVVDFYQSLPEDSVRKKIIDGTGKTAKTVWGAVSLPFRAPKMIYESLGPEDKKIIDKTIEIGEYIFASPFLIPAALYDNLQRTGRITDRRKKKKEKYEASHPTRIDKKIVERTKSEAVFAKNLFGVGYNPLGLDDVPEVKKSIKGSSSYKSSLRFNIESEGNQPQILFADHIIAEGSGKSYTFKQFMNYWGKRGRMNSRVLSKERGNNVFIGSPEGELTEIPQKVKGKIDIGNIVDSARYAYQGFVNVHREEPTDVKIELKPGTMITEDGVIVSGILGYMKLKNSEGNSEEIQIAPDGNLLQINGNSLISPYINAAAEFANTINSEYGIKNWEMIVNNDIRRNEAARRDLIIAREKIQKSKNYRENIKTERSPEIVTAAYKIMSNAMRTGNPERVDMAIQYLSAKYGMKKEDISNLVPPKLTKVPRVRKKNKIIMHTALQFMQAARPDNYSFDLTDSESSFNMEHYIQNKHSERIDGMKIEARKKIFEDVFDYIKQETESGKPLKDIVHDISGSHLGRKADLLLDISGLNHTRNYITRSVNLVRLARSYGYRIDMSGQDIRYRKMTGDVNQYELVQNNSKSLPPTQNHGNGKYIHSRKNERGNHNPKFKPSHVMKINGHRTIRK